MQRMSQKEIGINDVAENGGHLFNDSSTDISQTSLEKIEYGTDSLAKSLTV